MQELIRRLVERGQIYQGSYEGWYDEGQEEFVTESTARENEYKSAISGKALVRYSEKTWFFRLSNWIESLKKYIDEHPDFIQPTARRNEVRSKLDQGVEDLSISRAREKLGGWGIPMPNDPSHSVYVWIDALSNYYTALGLPPAGDEFDNKFPQYWPANVHLIGKDILWFHAVYWPCMLMALDIPLPRTIYAHGWWTSEGKKMSKTLGNFISRETIAEICRDYGVDYYRYFLLRAVAFGSDGDFSREMLLQRYNAELANGLGNLLSRTVNMIGKYFEGALPPAKHTILADGALPEDELLNIGQTLYDDAVRAMEGLGFEVYLSRITALVDAANRFIEVTAPFKLAKDPAQRDRLGTILYNCAEAVRLALVYLSPVMPSVAPRGLAQLGWQIPAGQTLDQFGRWGVLTPGTKMTKGEGLFPRKEQPK